MRALAQPQASGAARLGVWHTGKVLEWARTYEEDVRLELAQAEEDLQQARTREGEAEEAQTDALNALTASGADQTALIRERIKRAQEKHRETEADRATMAARLKEFDQVLPSSSGDLELLRATLAQQAAQLEGDLGELSREYETQA